MLNQQALKQIQRETFSGESLAHLAESIESQMTGMEAAWSLTMKYGDDGPGKHLHITIAGEAGPVNEGPTEQRDQSRVNNSEGLQGGSEDQ